MTAALTTPEQGWLYDLLRWAGVGPDTASRIQHVIVKPVTVLAVVAVAFLASRLGNRAIRHWLGRAARRVATVATGESRAARRAMTLTATMANVWRVFVGVIAVLVTLETIGINLTPLLAGATVVGATIGFGAQSMVRDLLAGFLLIVEGQFDIGETIVVGDTTGVVEDVALRVTQVRSGDGTLWFVPNGEIRKLANPTRGWALARVEVEVPPTSPVQALMNALRDAGQAFGADDRYRSRMVEPPVIGGVVSADIDKLVCRVDAKVRLADKGDIENALRVAVVERLQGAGIYVTPVT